MVTKEQALTHSVFHNEHCDKWRANGRVRTWKRSPERFECPVKFGLYRYGTISNLNNIFVHLPGDPDCKRPMNI